MLRFTTSIYSQIGGDYGPLAVTFDAVLAALDRLPRMFIEPDGSFVWTGLLPDGAPWQVDGNLIDQGDVLAYMELNGSCPEEQFDQVLTTLGWPAAKLSFQLPRRGIYLNEAEFRHLAESELGAV